MPPVNFAVLLALVILAAGLTLWAVWLLPLAGALPAVALLALLTRAALFRPKS